VDERERHREVLAINRAIASAEDYDEVLRRVVDGTATFTGATACLLLLSQEDGLARVVRSVGIDPARAARLAVPLNERIDRELRGLLGFQARDEFVGVPVIGKRGMMGVLAVYRQAPQAVEGVRDDELISAFADQAAIALDNAERITERKRAEEHLRRSGEQLRALATKLQSIREEEKSRIARDLHDELGQALAALKIHLRSLESAIGALGGDGGKTLLDRVVAASALADETVETVHRIAVELRPGTLDHLGLGVTLQQEARRFEQRTGIRCDTHLPEHLPALEPELATALYRICQEAMTNVFRHAEASRVAVRLDVASDSVTLEVDDDGRGFDFASLHIPSALGLLGMIERARALGGEVTFRQASAGRGTVVSASIPFPSVPRSEPPPAAAQDVPQGVPPRPLTSS